MTANCSACPVRTYNYSQSSTFNATVEHPLSSITLGPESPSPVTLSGFVAADRLCFSQQSSVSNSTIEVCLPRYEFFAVQGVSSDIFFTPETSGVLGLGFDLPNNGASFIQSLKDAGQIERLVVAVSYEGSNQIVRIGEAIDKSDVHTYQTTNKAWKIEVRGYSFLNKTTETEYLSYAVIDSFAQGI